MSRTAVIVTDMLNPYDHEDSDPLAENVKGIIEPLKGLIDATSNSEADLVYVNDNYEDFTATSKDIGAAAMDGEHPELVEPILPPKGSLFVQKVRHSAFYSTSLDHLLRARDIETVILAGQVTEQCILYTALDAYIRGYEMVVPPDAVAHINAEFAQTSLKMMEANMHAELKSVADLDF